MIQLEGEEPRRDVLGTCLGFVRELVAGGKRELFYLPAQPPHRPEPIRIYHPKRKGGIDETVWQVEVGHFHYGWTAWCSPITGRSMEVGSPQEAAAWLVENLPGAPRDTTPEDTEEVEEGPSEEFSRGYVLACSVMAAELRSATEPVVVATLRNSGVTMEEAIEIGTDPQDIYRLAPAWAEIAGQDSATAAVVTPDTVLPWLHRTHTAADVVEGMGGLFERAGADVGFEVVELDDELEHVLLVVRTSGVSQYLDRTAAGWRFAPEPSQPDRDDRDAFLRTVIGLTVLGE